MTGGPKPQVRDLDDRRSVWFCCCTTCECESHAFILGADGSVECATCRHLVPQLEVHIVPNLRKRQ